MKRPKIPMFLLVASLAVLSACTAWSRQTAFAQTTVVDKAADGKETSRTVTYKANGSALAVATPAILALNGGQTGAGRDHRNGGYGSQLYGAQSYGQGQDDNGQLCNFHLDYCSTTVVASSGYYGRNSYGVAPGIPVGYAQSVVPPMAGQVSVSGSQSSTTTVMAAANPDLEAKVKEAAAAAKVAKKMARTAVKMECERIVADAEHQPEAKLKECQAVLDSLKKAEEK